MEAIAHFDASSGRTHPLAEHLREAGKLAQGFAAKFDSGEWARLTGLWHDLGKYRPAFQEMIQGAAGESAHLECGQGSSKIDHSSVGASYAQDRFGPSGLPIVLVTAGHHGGLPNLSYWKETRYPEKQALIKEVPMGEIPGDILDGRLPELPSFLRVEEGDRETRLRRREFWTRMVFSALVDADFLDTERFFSSEKADVRGDWPSIDILAARLREHLARFSGFSGSVNELRGQVLDRCRKAASCPQGVFSLTVPTGGGKTYASLSFALEHCLAHGLSRVIVVAPYLTIIDQTIKAYRQAIEPDAENPAVIEHHSNMDPEHEKTLRNRLAAENWDAPVVVTTAVEFFESLFSNRTSACRKLHNLAHSVIVLDEAQTLPGEFLTPILEVLQELADHYGTSILLSTATQPDLSERRHPDGRRIAGLRHIRELAGTSDEISKTFQRLKRVRIKRVATKSWDEVAALMAREPRALAITHRRDDARELAFRVHALSPRQPLFHLSALMCARHRQERIQAIREALKVKGASVRVVSTQLVEAGVDLDFPVVFRAMAGLDALIQSAGRCNREGLLAEGGELIVFNSPTSPPIGYLRTAADRAKAMLTADPALDMLAPETYRDFDRSMHRVQDSRGIQNFREKLEFKEVAEAFKLIDDDWQATVVVPWGPPDNRRQSLELLDQADKIDDSKVLRYMARRLQGYGVSIPRWLANKWMKAGALYSVKDYFLALAPQYRHLYSDEFGLTASKDIPAADPSALIG